MEYSIEELKLIAGVDKQSTYIELPQKKECLPQMPTIKANNESPTLDDNLVALNAKYNLDIKIINV